MSPSADLLSAAGSRYQNAQPDAFAGAFGDCGVVSERAGAGWEGLLCSATEAPCGGSAVSDGASSVVWSEYVFGVKKSFAGCWGGGELACTFCWLLHSRNHEPLAVFRAAALVTAAGVASASTVSADTDSAGASSFLSPSVVFPFARALSSPFMAASGSSDGVGPGSGVLDASSTVALFAFTASVYPSGRDHQLVHPHAFATCSAFAGSGGKGALSPVGAVSGAALVSSFFAVGTSTSSTEPSEETVILVVEVGSAKLLLDLRFVRKRAGDSLLGDLTSSLGSSEVAPPLTLIPMVSCAVFTTAGALDRQLPVPPSHFRLLFGVCVPVVVGVVAPSVAIEASESGLLATVSFDVVLAASASVVGSVVLLALLSVGFVDALACLSSLGASELILTFLRGLIAPVSAEDAVQASRRVLSNAEHVRDSG